MFNCKKAKKFLLDPSGFFLESRHAPYRRVASFYAKWVEKKSHAMYRAREQDTPVSIVMAAHNAERWIDDAVSSLLNQTHAPAEIILIDDASTDGTRDKMKNWVACDTRIKAYASDTNVGPYVCKNFGIQQTSHNIVAFSDADDVSQPDRIALQLGALSQKKHIACFCRRLNCDESMTPLSNRMTHGTAIASLMLKKQEVTQKAGYFDTVRFAADSEFADRLRALYGRSAICTLPMPLYHMRQHDASITRSGDGGHLWGQKGRQQNPLRAGYHQAYNNWHASFGRLGNSEKTVHPSTGAPFPLPIGMSRPEILPNFHRIEA